jgi:hypothetical protein
MRVPCRSIIVAALVCCVAPRASRAQSADRDAVLATVEKVFTAMRTRDTVLLMQVVDTGARLVGVSGRGTPAVTLTTFPAFGAAFSRAKPGDVWNERMYDPEVRIDDAVAQVWGYYTFHITKTFSHCGVDAFMLVKVGGVWKITQIADSRRTTGCTHQEP